MSEKKLYKPNVVYVVEIHGYQYYVGCESFKKEKMTDSRILHGSGNPLMAAYRKKLITYQEYKDSCKLVYVEEYDTKEEAQNREAELIKKFKEHYGDQCLNKSPGNKYGPLGVICSEKRKKAISEYTKGRYINRPDQSKPVLQYTKDGQFIAEYPSISEASRRTEGAIQNISNCCRGKRKSAYGSIWKYV